MTPDQIAALGGVAARNMVAKVDDAAALYAVRRLELAGKSRGIVLDTIARRLRVIGAPEDGPVLPEAESAPGLPDATCSRCRVVTAIGEEEIGALFGWRMVPAKEGRVRRRQPQCKRCRSLPPLRSVPPGVDPTCPDVGAAPS